MQRCIILRAAVRSGGDDPIPHRLTFAQLGTVVHTLVVVLVFGTEVGVVVVPQRVLSSVAAVPSDVQPVAVQLIAEGEVLVLSVPDLALPVLHTQTGSLAAFGYRKSEPSREEGEE